MRNYLVIAAALIVGCIIGYFVGASKGCKIKFKASSGQPIEGFNKKKFSALLEAGQAEKYLTNFKDRHSGSDIAFNIERSDIAKLLDNPRSTDGLRAYLGVKDRSRPDEITLMFVGVDMNKENVFYTIGGDDYVVDYTNPCPTDCPPTGFDRRTMKPTL